MNIRQILCSLRPQGHDGELDVEPNPSTPALFVRCLACGYTSTGVQWAITAVPTRKGA